MLALSRSQKLPQTGEDTQVTQCTGQGLNRLYIGLIHHNEVVEAVFSQIPHCEDTLRQGKDLIKLNKSRRFNTSM